MNLKNKGIDGRNHQPLQAVVSSSDDRRLDFIRDFGIICLGMIGNQGKREKQLSRDTAIAIHHSSTCAESFG